MNLRYPPCLALLLTAVCVAPAGAVINGETIDPSEEPQFATFNGCGGTLVAPDRILTAAHCVRGVTPEALSYVAVGGVPRGATHFAMHPNWRRQNGPSNFLDDVALLELDAPVTGVVPAALGGSSDQTARVVGRGRSTVPGSGAREGFDGLLRRAALRPISDAECARAYRTKRGNAGERFNPRMLCAVDVDGRAPLSSGCNGDSGGPLLSGTPAAPVLLGVVSWGGWSCGADRLPNVYAEVARYRSFITDPSPTWAPMTRTPAKVSGTPRVGSRLTCAVSGFDTEPAELAISWTRQGGRSAQKVGHKWAYTVRRADRGRDLVCNVRAITAGGWTDVPYDARKSKVRIPR